MSMTKEKKKPQEKREHVAHPHVLGEKKNRKSVIQPKSRAQVYSAAYVMCHDDSTPHIMTHDAILIVLTLLLHGTHSTFILSTLSLYILFPLSISLLLLEKKWWKRRKKKKEKGFFEGTMTAFGA